ncbi:Hypothetical predicted protein [Marmota monax]|uniref:Tumor necrosis factor ligand superfamily member 15 n=1 Tax=Marmota monax TaxID=9995 RepID=A0A5E4ANK5_MARMO|nr:tumor necrosis factor ligand superfamily member 15 isoform X1 [Marmota marmota marmota]VTJ58072.1 Hypothetical predicted protein [Marmota monax]
MGGSGPGGVRDASRTEKHGRRSGTGLRGNSQRGNAPPGRQRRAQGQSQAGSQEGWRVLCLYRLPARLPHPSRTYRLPAGQPAPNPRRRLHTCPDAPLQADREKPRAHLTVVRQTPSPHLKNQFPALHWEHELGLAFTKNKMKYTNKFLVIPESGDYFVYSQITFRGTKSECGSISQGRQQIKPDSIIVVITKVTDSYPEPAQLLTGTKSVCEISNNWFQPLYLGAMFSLREGDKLMVNVSDISLVDYTKEDKTFFGAFLL